MSDLDPACLHLLVRRDLPASAVVEEFGLLMLASAVGPSEGDFRGGAAHGIEQVAFGAEVALAAGVVKAHADVAGGVFRQVERGAPHRLRPEIFRLGAATFNAAIFEQRGPFLTAIERVIDVVSDVGARWIAGGDLRGDVQRLNALAARRGKFERDLWRVQCAVDDAWRGLLLVRSVADDAAAAGLVADARAVFLQARKGGRIGLADGGDVDVCFLKLRRRCIEAQMILTVVFDLIGEVDSIAKGTRFMLRRAAIGGDGEGAGGAAAQNEAVFAAGLVDAPFAIIRRCGTDDVGREKFERDVLFIAADDTIGKIRPPVIYGVAVACLAIDVRRAVLRAVHLFRLIHPCARALGAGDAFDHRIAAPENECLAIVKSRLEPAAEAFASPQLHERRSARVAGAILRALVGDIGAAIILM